MFFSSKLHPRAAFFLATHHSNPFSAIDKMPIAVARKSYELFSTVQGGTPPKLFNIENRILDFAQVAHTIPIRIYRPSNQKTPLLIYIHGGGWSLGSLNTHDTLCRSLSKTSGCTIVSVDYRLAPEHPYPAALYDLDLVYNWCCANTEILNTIPDKIAIGGDSSGGNLAAALTIQCVKKAQALPSFQLLLYPALDLNLTQESMIKLGTKHFLTKSEMEYYRANYAANVDIGEWLISPLFYPTVHQRVPAIILTAECDPLRDDGKLYAQKLKKAGVLNEYKEVPGIIHGFLQMRLLFPEHTSHSFQWLAEKMNAMWNISPSSS